MQQATLRIRRARRRGETPKNYRRTWEAVDEPSGRLLATCDLVGQPAFATHVIVDEQGGTWRVAPNRRLMPSRWIVRDPHGRIAMQLDQRLLGRLFNPFRRMLLALLDEDGNEVLGLVEPPTGILDRIFGGGNDDWMFMTGATVVANRVRLPAAQPSARGLFGKLSAMLDASDIGIVSNAAQHVLPAPVVIALLIIAEELTDKSAG